MSRGLRAFLGFAVVLACTTVLLPPSALANRQSNVATKRATASLDLGVLAQLNQIRVQHGLVPLTLSPNLARAAQAHSQEMLAHGYFAHESPDGSVFWKRIQAYYPQGPGTWSVGENLYWTSGAASVSGSMQAWMASPEHRANILDPAWRQIGIAAVSSPAAPGTYAGLSVTVITTDFGVRG